MGAPDCHSSIPSATATESHTWDVTQLFGTKDGGTEGHYYRFAKEGMRGVRNVRDFADLVKAEASLNTKKYSINSIFNSVTYHYYKDGVRYNEPVTNYDAIGLAVNVITDADLYRAFTNSTGSANLGKFMSEKFCATTYMASLLQAPGSCHVYNGNMIYYKLNGSYTAETALAKVKSDYIVIQDEATPITFTSLFLSASSTADELTQMPADAIPLSEIQFADCNWSIEEAVYDAPEADANGVIDTIHQVTGQMRIQYSLDAAEQIDTLQKEYAALEARVTALENA